MSIKCQRALNVDLRETNYSDTILNKSRGTVKHIDVEHIVRKLVEYKVPELNIQFVDREIETETLMSTLGSLEISWTLVVYGPWGCGKSEYFRALTNALRDLEDVVTIYVNLAEEEIKQIVQVGNIELRDVVVNVLREIGGAISILVNLYTFVEKLTTQFRLRDKMLILVIDELTRSLEHFRLSIRDFVSGLDKKIHVISSELQLARFFPILITSDQTAVEMFERECGKSLTLYLVWHLPEDAYTTLLEELKCPSEIREIVYRLTGGCPRAAVELKYAYKWDTRKWLINVIDRVVAAVEQYCVNNRVDVRYLIEHELVADPDTVAFKPISRLMLKENLLIRLRPETHRLSKVNPSEWIGKRYAWQMPAYMYVLKAMIDKKTIDIGPEHVMAMLREH